MTAEERPLFSIEKLNVPRSDISAITHMDYSARIQTVHEKTNPRYYALLKNFQGKDRLPHCDQYKLKRSRLTDRLYTRRRLPVIHGIRDRSPGGR